MRACAEEGGRLREGIQEEEMRVGGRGREENSSASVRGGGGAAGIRAWIRRKRLCARRPRKCARAVVEEGKRDVCVGVEEEGRRERVRVWSRRRESAYRHPRNSVEETMSRTRE